MLYEPWFIWVHLGIIAIVFIWSFTKYITAGKGFLRASVLPVFNWFVLALAATRNLSTKNRTCQNAL